MRRTRGVAPRRLASAEPSKPGRVRPSGRLSLGFVACSALFYLVCAGWGTYPAWTRPTTAVPGILGDQLQHVWLMKWYRSCLVEGRNPLICPEVEYPVGSPAGNFSPLHLQSLAYLTLSAFINNDILIYNILWTFAFLLAGVGTLVLAWRVSGDRGCALFAGLQAMLSTPMIVRSWGHLELMYFGSMALFLAAWLELVDRPRVRSLGMAAGSYLLTTASAAYFAIYAIFPAVLYLAWAFWKAAREDRRIWLIARARWSARFSAVVLPVLVLLFLPQIWARSNGYTTPWTRADFDSFGCGLAGYLLPTNFQRLHAWAPMDLSMGSGVISGPSFGGSYLGIACLSLLAIGLIGRVRIERRGFWWLALGVAVVLSLGPYRQVMGARIELPSGWLWHVFPPFRLIRDVSRFNLLVVILAAVISAMILRRLLSRVTRSWARGVILGSVCGVALLDLGVRIEPVEVPDLPAFYSDLLEARPGAAFLELEPPQPEGLPGPLALGYWQSLHGGKTSVSFSGLVNRRMKDRIGWSSPVAASRTDLPDFLENGDEGIYDFITRQRFKDYLWLFMRANGYHYLVVHKPRLSSTEEPEGRLRLHERLSSALVREDEAARVYDVERMERPSRPTIVLTDGWRVGLRGGVSRVVGREAALAYYNPDPERELTLMIRARGNHRRRLVRLMDGGRELGRWAFPATGSSGVFARPFRLPEGRGELRLLVNGESKPGSLAERAMDSDERPFGLLVEELALVAMPEQGVEAATE